MRYWLALLLAALVLPAVAAAQRLPRTVLPHHYELTLAPDFATDSFDGEAVIHVSIQEPTRAIELHAAEIDFGAVTVSAGGREQTAKVTLVPERESAVLTLGKSVPAGPAVLRIAFRGVLNDDLRGFYLGANEGEKYAASQLESTDARRAFPCFDEPWMKATFDVTLVIDDGHVAFSNGAQIADTSGPEPGKHTVRFATTPRMSTYLVALVVGRFDCLEGETDGVPLRICAIPEKAHLGTFALEATKATLEYFNTYFDYPYPFGKLDQIGIADFAAGAMENTGAIIYRESALLLDPDRASLTQQYRVAAVIAHEIAHMWFGDLVTMEWWDDIWLNEGFASFIEDKAVGSWKPEWNVDLLVSAAAGWPLEVDVLRSTRRIRSQAETPAEIDALFDGVAYGKTAAVLHMLDSYIGADTMRQGLAAYMAKHAYGNTSAADFLEALSGAAGTDVGAIMRSFVEQPGVPVVAIDARCEGTETVVSLAQQRFFVDRSLAGSVPDQLWKVPICFAEGECVVLSREAQSTRLDGCRPALVANWMGRGYYLTEYGDETRRHLLAGIDTLSVAERLILLRDEWYLVRASRRSLNDYLDLVAVVAPVERELRVADEYLGHLDYIEANLVAAADREAYQAWLREILQPLAAEVGWRPTAKETPEQMQFRASVLTTLGRAGDDPEVQQQARDLATAYLGDRTAVHPTMAKTVMTLAALEGDADLYDDVLAAYREASNPEDRSRFMSALATFRHRDLRQRSLDLTLTEDIRTQDISRLLLSILDDPRSNESVWAFVQANWDALLARMPARQHGYLLPRAGRAFCDQDLRDELEAFAATADVDIQPRRMDQTRDRIANCIEMKTLHQEKLSEYLGATSPEVVKN